MQQLCGKMHKRPESSASEAEEQGSVNEGTAWNHWDCDLDELENATAEHENDTVDETVDQSPVKQCTRSKSRTITIPDQIMSQIQSCPLTQGTSSLVRSAASAFTPVPVFYAQVVMPNIFARTRTSFQVLPAQGPEGDMLMAMGRNDPLKPACRCQTLHSDGNGFC